ncbi:M20 family metallopeptidase [Rummeliibacillus sp. POC4]|nr:M20 family metallopeptidase [Rummeliibacillus sp. POC4]RIJ63410.1 M20 family peptidase [Rummeliibacillus sp. POC4]
MISYEQGTQVSMLKLLEELVNIDSGSTYKEGIDLIGDILSKEYQKLGFDVQVNHQERNGNNLVIRHKSAENPKIILIGHMDTVFKKGTVRKRPFKIIGDRAYGPGVIDMKGSQVELLYAMKELVENNHSVAIKNVEIVLNSDEEIGSPISRSLIQKVAFGKEYALILEPARKDGSIVSERKGGGNYKLIIRGKSAHSGIEPEIGVSAIEEFAHKVIKLHSLNDEEEGINVNVGIIRGGIAANVVAPRAEAYIDVRISKIEQMKILSKKIKEICSVSDVPGTKIELIGSIDRYPMVKDEKSRKLLSIIKEIGCEMGITLKDVSTGGGSDASTTVSLGIPTIDGLGPVGGRPHSEDEYLEIPSLVERTNLLINIIKRLSEDKN